MSEKIELYKQHALIMEDHIYYQIALSVDSIGHAVHQTHGKEFYCFCIHWAHPCCVGA